MIPDSLNIPKRTGRKSFYANVLNEAIIAAFDEIGHEEDYYRNLLDRRWKISTSVMFIR